MSQASQQFNAAVVAVEMAWLQLFADAGCLTDEQEKQAVAAVRDYTTALQTSLRDAGYYDGEVDGIYGPATVDAVEALQEAHGLPSTGTVDKATADALQDDLAAKGGATAQQEVATTAAVQQTLQLAGFWDGPVDGVWTPALTEALKDFQTELGVEPTGTVDAATIDRPREGDRGGAGRAVGLSDERPLHPVVGRERVESDRPVLDLRPASDSRTRSGIIRNGARPLAAWMGEQDDRAQHQHPGGERQLEPLLVRGAHQQRQRDHVAHVGDPARQAPPHGARPC